MLKIWDNLEILVEKMMPDVFREERERIKYFSLGGFADWIASIFDNILFAKREVILNTIDQGKRISFVLKCLQELLEKTSSALEKGQGEQSSGNKEAKKSEDELITLYKRYKKIEKKFFPNDRRIVEERFSSLKKSKKDSSEYSMIERQVRFIIDLFSLEESNKSVDIEIASQSLNKGHYGLKEAKEKIIQYIATKILNSKRKAPILCFVGPPGTGKTSLGKSIARALNKKFCRMSLGGNSDEAKIKGHKPTYIAAMSGDILQLIKNTGSSNPVFMLDEIDKLGGGAKGNDIEPALLEVLDPEQNDSFRDHYAQVAFDLSKVFFITTANTTNFSDPLKDRMSIIRLPGYTEEEKVKIAERHLIPRQLKETGVGGRTKISFGVKSILELIRKYTKEAGVRNLEREIGNIFSILAIEILKKDIKRFTVNAEKIKKFLGSSEHVHRKIEKMAPGLSTGLFVTERGGGGILFVESVFLEEEKGDSLILTGNLEKVIRESAVIALSFLKSNAENLMIKKNFFKNKTLHIHVPDGAIQKDGPSAGLALLFSLFSLVHNTKIKENLAVSGEIRLKGKVSAIGGAREKILGAKRAGAEELIFPLENKEKIDSLPRYMKKNIRFHFVENAWQALEIAFPDFDFDKKLK